MSGVAWWSQTAGNNATYDPTIGWAEGMAPSSVNDSARAMMASTAKWRDDITGAIVTGGTSTAFTVTSWQNFDTLTRLNGQMIAFSPHATNAGTTTLNVDGLGAKPLRSAPSIELAAGHLVQGTPYVAVYNSGDAAFYLQGFYGNPYSIPIGGVMPFAGSTAPNSSFVLPYGQAISRTTYSAAFSLMGTTYGTGDGSTTFNVPDLRGRVVAGLDNMGGSAAGRLTDATSGFGDGLGETGGTQTKALSTANLPPYTPSGTISGGQTAFSVTFGQAGGGTAATILSNISNGSGTLPTTVAPTITANPTFTGTAQGGTSTAFGIVQPTMTLNYLLRII
ncbi:phage tail protein [Bradyrhizobium zhanjiangense]|uniref:Phage tail protein n=1 Tax=Bradyrhizobium zhanjiangense TaxID=1325107 RepID=A0A4Q0Q7L7_9BRAD|nr:tail fiber protein [Bradyrhizobium zhanjiangense]RXG85347.1 phage tail protein [Bradyrhizobium zhanjiangense]